MMNIFEEKETGIAINFGTISKENIDNLSSSIAHSVMEGNEYAIEQYVKAKGMSELAKSIMDKLKDLAIDEATKYNEKDKVAGCTFQVKSTPTTYDFSHNQEWAMLNAQMESIKKKMKYIESLMVEAIKHGQMADADGFIVEPAVVKSSGGTTIAVNIPK